MSGIYEDDIRPQPHTSNETNRMTKMRQPDRVYESFYERSTEREEDPHGPRGNTSG